MKHYLSLLALVWMVTSARSQSDFENSIDSMFSGMDLNQVPTGILYEHGFPWTHFGYWEGQLADSNKADLDKFGFLMAALSDMTVDPLAFPYTPDDYRDKSRNWVETDPVPIALLHQYYSKLGTDAIDSNLVDVVDSVFYDVPNRPYSPYLQKEVFMVTTVRKTIRTRSFKLIFNTDLIYNNTGKTIQSLEVDMGDGNGFDTIAPDSVLETRYLSNGLKTITFRLTYTDQTVMHGHSEIDYQGVKSNLTGPYSQVDREIHLTASKAHEGVYAGGTVYVSYACGHTSIQKPFIWAEGFNPVVGDLDLSLDYEKAIQRLSFSHPIVTEDLPILQHLENEGYDLIVIDYDDGGTYLQQNAYLIEAVLGFVNNEKHWAGSNEKNVIMGQSMGGMCARYALRDMELNSQDHEVGTYISFDSGHFGVNVPLGVQYALRHASGIRAGGTRLREWVQGIEDAENLLDLPSSRQMMVYHCDEYFDYNANAWYSVQPSQASLHEDYYLEQNYDLGMPDSCENIAIANGSLKGTAGLQPFTEGDTLIWLEENQYGIFEGLGFQKFIPDILGLDADVDILIRALPAGLSPYVIYSANISFSIFGFYVTNSQTSRSSAGRLAIDHVPGGFVGENPINPANFGGFQPEKFKMNTWAFTPTVSTLHYYEFPTEYTDPLNLERSFLNMETDLLNDKFKGMQNYEGMTTATSYSGFSGPFNNTAHTFFNSTNAPFLLFHVVGDDSFDNIPALSSSGIYNLGKEQLMASTDIDDGEPRKTTSIIDHDFTIGSSCALGVNSYDRIGLNPQLVTTGPTVAADAHFMAEIRNSCGETNTIVVSVNSSGDFKVGDANGRTGELHVYDGNKIVVLGDLEVYPHSKLILRDSSELIIKGGGKLIIHDHASVVIEPNAKLRYEDNAKIITDGANNSIWVNGQIELGPDADFAIDHSGSWTSGAIIFNTDLEAFKGEGNNTVMLQGADDEDDMVFITNNKALKIYDTDIKMVYLLSARVNLDEKSAIRIQQPVRVTAVDFSSHYYNYGFLFTDKNNFSSCDFLNVRLQAYLYIENADILHAYNCTFTQDDQYGNISGALVSVSGMGYSLNKCNFRLLPINTGIESFDMNTRSTIYDCDFYENSASSHPDAMGVLDESNVEIRVTRSTFDRLYFGIYKFYGNLILKCSEFENVRENNIWVSSCTISMQTSDGGGYNIIGPASSGPSIYLDNSHIMLFKGFNFIDVSSPYPCIDGTLMYTCTPGQNGNCYMDFSYNQWTAANTAASPLDFSVLSANSNSVQCITNDYMVKPSCGYYDENGPLDPEEPEYENGKSLLAGDDLMKIWSETIQDSITLVEAYNTGFMNMTVIDSLGSDLLAIKYFNDIISAGLDRSDSASAALLAATVTHMKGALENAFAAGVLLKEDNLSSFDRYSAMYNNALAYVTDTAIDSLNYIPQFYNEINKAHFMHVIGHTSVSLEMLDELEGCTLDTTEQQVLNSMKESFESYLLVQEMGFAALDTVISVDTSNYTTPDRVDFESIAFGAVITSPSDISYPNCGNYGAKDSPDEEDGIAVYPNPASSEVRVDVSSLRVEGARQISVMSFDGRLVHESTLGDNKKVEVIDTSGWTRGAYICSVTDSSGRRYTRKIIIR